MSFLFSYFGSTYRSKAGNKYRLREIDYEHLGLWAQVREGQVIVCEQSPASWLPFSPLKSISGVGRRSDGSQSRSTEVIWCNQ
jgi:hypothetical protein